jgi:hypothetical protein
MTAATMVPTVRGYWREIPAWERRDMTVCIAAICGGSTQSTHLVLCADWRISSSLGSSDSRLKVRYVSGNWSVLAAGVDTEIKAIDRLAFTNFLKHDSIDETNITTIVRDIINSRKKTKVEELVRNQYAISYDDLRLLPLVPVRLGVVAEATEFG